MISNDLDDKYYELEEAISTLEMQIKESKDKDVVSILENCKDKLQEEFNNIKDDTYVGINEGCFINKNKFEEKLGDRVLGVNSFFDNLIKSVKKYYGV